MSADCCLPQCIPPHRDPKFLDLFRSRHKNCCCISELYEYQVRVLVIRVHKYSYDMGTSYVLVRTWSEFVPARTVEGGTDECDILCIIFWRFSVLCGCETSGTILVEIKSEVCTFDFNFESRQPYFFFLLDDVK